MATKQKATFKVAGGEIAHLVDSWLVAMLETPAYRSEPKASNGSLLLIEFARNEIRGNKKNGHPPQTDDQERLENRTIQSTGKTTAGQRRKEVENG